MSYGMFALKSLLWLVVPAAAQTPEPVGYRMGDYRAPVPATVEGGTTIGIASLAALILREHPVLIDVLPAPRRPPDAPPDHVWLPLPHRDIPGSLWLPDVGRGMISPQLEAWFRERLRIATHGRADYPVVFYCLSECWMSWNATKRAASFGYTRAFWFEAGADGWEAAGKDLVVAHPETP